MPLRRQPRTIAVPLLAGLLALGACTTLTADEPTGALADPTDLTYQLVPSGDPARPGGIILSWQAPADQRVVSFVVYSRASTADRWSRRGETTSRSFHDAGIPYLQYYVASADQNGAESVGSEIVTVDERSRLPAPAALTPISLDRAIQLSWPANARLAQPALFAYYRVYSTGYDRATGYCAEQGWVLEGTTVSEDFLATGLANGVSRCFAVSTISQDGHESLWSPLTYDTPRFDARNVLIDASEVAIATSGFRFFDPATGVLGLVTRGDRSDLDFRVSRRSDGSLWLVPVRSDVTVALYGATPVADLTSIDVAPTAGFAASAIEAVPGYAYVFRFRLADGVHYGAVRVTHTGPDYLILDWAYQSDPGNPELRRAPAAGPAPRI
jgi:hypothetical protein